MSRRRSLFEYSLAGKDKHWLASSLGDFMVPLWFIYHWLALFCFVLFCLLAFVISAAVKFYPLIAGYLCCLELSAVLWQSKDDQKAIVDATSALANAAGKFLVAGKQLAAHPEALNARNQLNVEAR